MRGERSNSTAPETISPVRMGYAYSHTGVRLPFQHQRPNSSRCSIPQEWKLNIDTGHARICVGHQRR
jgi:hypothetical protein